MRTIPASWALHRVSVSCRAPFYTVQWHFIVFLQRERARFARGNWQCPCARAFRASHRFAARQIHSFPPSHSLALNMFSWRRRRRRRRLLTSFGTYRNCVRINYITCQAERRVCIVRQTFALRTPRECIVVFHSVWFGEFACRASNNYFPRMRAYLITFRPQLHTTYKYYALSESEHIAIHPTQLYSTKLLWHGTMRSERLLRIICVRFHHHRRILPRSCRENSKNYRKKTGIIILSEMFIQCLAAGDTECFSLYWPNTYYL